MLISYTLRDQRKINLCLKRSAKKNIIIRPVSQEQISINIPPHLSERKLRLWLSTNEHILEQTLARSPNTEAQASAPAYIWFQGEPCTLKQHEHAYIKHDHGLLWLPEQPWTQQQLHLKHYLYQHAGQRLLPRLQTHAEHLGLFLPAAALTNAKTLWGVCRRTTGIRLNWRLIGAPDCVVDYVCIHELCHLTHANHSSHFWALVNQHTSHTTAAKAWLKQYGNELFRLG